MISVKKHMTKVIAEQPEDSTYEEILRELAFVRMIDRGLLDIKKKNFISDKEIKRRIKSWQK